MAPPKERCKDLVGKRVRLLRPVKTLGGDFFPEGHVMEVAGTWRGRFELNDLVVTIGHGWSCRKGVRRMNRNAFEVVP